MAQAVDITQFLIRAQDPNAQIRTEAEQQLKSFQDQNYNGFLASLVQELSSAQKPADSRRLAGLILKNTLDAKEEARKQELVARWNTVDPTLRNHIKEALLSTLHADLHDVRHTAALVIAKVAAIELPQQPGWPDLVKTLLSNMSAQPPNPGLRQATLETLGYVCEEMHNVKDDVLSTEEINMILTAVVSGMGPTEPEDTRVAAITALTNAIEFAEHNFENEQERNYIMQMVCQGCVATESRIRTSSFSCLHEIAASYYQFLPAYIGEIFNITIKTIKSDEDEDAALQAIEFWSTICDYEIEMEEEEGVAGEPPMVNHKFIAQVSAHLVPVLLEQLTKQEEGQEQDETTWNLSMAAGTCLSLMARVAGDAMVPLVMPFVEANIGKKTSPEDWRYREAATIAFGSMLDGPSAQSLMGVIRNALGFLVQAATQDPHPYVRDTTFWTIGRIFEFSNMAEGESIINKEMLLPIVQVMIAGLKDQPHIAYRACDAIGKLAEGFKAGANDSGVTSPMSPFFKDVVTALLETAHRHSNAFDQNRLQISAFEAINDMVRAAGQDTLDTVAQLIPVFLTEIVKTFEIPITTAEAREKQAELQGQLCGVLQVIMQRLSDSEAGKTLVLGYADNVISTILKIFSARGATVHEEAMLAVGAFTYACGKQFTKYLPSFYPYLKAGLANHQEWQVCLSTVGVLGDVCRNVEDQIWPYCDEIMHILVQNLGNNEVHRSIKPHILSAFGDIALVVGDKFEKYLDIVKRMLQQAMHLSIMQSANTTDEDTMDYNNDLRNGILDAYSGIFQGLGPAKCDQLMKSEVPYILQFINSIARDGHMDSAVVKSSVNLLGDICSVCTHMKPLLQQGEWQRLLEHCSEWQELEWAAAQIQTALNTA